MSLSCSYSGRKITVKGTPATTLSALLEQACEKFKLSPPSSFTFYHRNSELDLSLQFRLSGLTNNAGVEIKRRSNSNTPVKVAIQFEGKRIQHNCTASLALWQLLCEIEQKENVNITNKDNDGKFIQPVLTFMNKPFGTLDSLKSSTLAHIGLSSGSGLLKLSFEQTTLPLQEIENMNLQEQEEKQENEKKKEEKLKERNDMLLENKKKQEENAKKAQEENKKIQEENKKLQEAEKQKQKYIKEQQEREKKALTQKNRRDEIPISNDVPEEVPPKIPGTGSTVQTSTIEPCDRLLKVFPPNTSSHVSELVVPDEFYEVTPGDVQKLLAIEKQKKKQQEADNSMLRTKKMREEDEIKRKPVFLKTNIRVKFPDKTELQGTFNSGETILNLREFLVHQCLAYPEEDFELFISPPKTVLRDNNCTFRNQNLCPSALVYFNYTDKNCTKYPFLRDSVLEHVQDKIPKDFTFVKQEENHTNNVVQPVNKQNTKPKRTLNQNNPKSSSTKSVVPKWLQLSKKK